MKTSRPFGVEIELFGSLYSHRNKPGVVTSRDYYGYATPNDVNIKLAPGWKFDADQSCGIEFISPPLVDTSPIQKQILAIVNSGLQINFRRSGLHVHVSCSDVERPDLIHIAKFCRHFDRAIFSYMHPLRIKNRFCRTLGVNNDKLAQQCSPDSFMTNNMERYKGCNLASYEKHGTVEFRYAESTLDYERICALVDLYIKIVEYAALHPGEKINSPRKTKEKRIFLLDLIGVRESYRTKLLDVDYSVQTERGYQLT